MVEGGGGWERELALVCNFKFTINKIHILKCCSQNCDFYMRDNCVVSSFT